MTGLKTTSAAAVASALAALIIGAGPASADAPSSAVTASAGASPHTEHFMGPYSSEDECWATQSNYARYYRITVECRTFIYKDQWVFFYDDGQ